MKRLFFAFIIVISSVFLLSGCFCKVPNAGAAYMTTSANHNSGAKQYEV